MPLHKTHAILIILMLESSKCENLVEQYLLERISNQYSEGRENIKNNKMNDFSKILFILVIVFVNVKKSKISL